MSDAEYNAMGAVSLRHLSRLTPEQLTGYLARSNRTQRQMIRQALAAQGVAL